MNKNNTGILAFLGLLVAVAIGGYFVVPKLFDTDGATVSGTATATKPETGDTVATPVPETAPKLEDAETAAAGDEAEKAAASDGWVMPSFDVLRVEPDGSTVIAGKAEPGTRLDIMNGSTVIASTAVGPSGDFAAVLDAPLPAGDYQLSLRIVGAEGAERMSEEIATISIPETVDGDLLAMVTKPGKASRIIAQPAAPVSTDTTEAPQAEDSAQSAETAGPDGSDGEVATSDAAPSTSGDNVEIAASEAASPDEPGSEAAGSGEAEVADADETAAPGSGSETQIATPELPEMSSLLTTTAPEITDAAELENAVSATDTDAAAVGTDEDKATANPEAGENPETVAAASPDTEMAAAANQTAETQIPADATVRVDAVEIEGDRIFIAGSATPGATVQVSADGVFIGTEKADETGRFIVEATAQLAVGDHTISAELMDSATGKVMLRAAVPFSRPEGEAHAAVAPSGEQAATSMAGNETSVAPQAETTPMILPDINGLSKLREDAFEALSALEQMVAKPDAPDAAALAEARARAVTKLEVAATAELPADSTVEAKAMAQSMRAQADAALAVINPPKAAAPEAGSDVAAASNAAESEVVAMRDMLKQAQTALSQPADVAVAAANAPAPGTDEVQTGEPGEPRTIVQAPLASAPGAVIIRRGDTLWQISRRTYGQGVRYTTIYLANRSQIQDPDRIKPGQVFSVPETPLQNAEELHRQLRDKSNR